MLSHEKARFLHLGGGEGGGGNQGTCMFPLNLIHVHVASYPDPLWKKERARYTLHAITKIHVYSHTVYSSCVWPHTVPCTFLPNNAHLRNPANTCAYMDACTHAKCKPTYLIGTGILHLEDGEEVVGSWNAYSRWDILALVPVLYSIEDNLSSWWLTDKLFPTS